VDTSSSLITRFISAKLARASRWALKSASVKSPKLMFPQLLGSAPFPLGLEVPSPIETMGESGIGTSETEVRSISPKLNFFLERSQPPSEEVRPSAAPEWISLVKREWKQQVRFPEVSQTP
jgi:hypothetical protein